MYTETWVKHQILDPQKVIKFLKRKTDRIVSFDTETSGLNYLYARPFILTFALCDEYEGNHANAFAFDMTTQPEQVSQQMIQALYDCTRNGLLIAHNAVFDLHMCFNIYPIECHDHITDTQIMIRLGTDALQENMGGAPIALKQFAKQYISPDADDDKKVINRYRASLAKEYNEKLRTALPNKKTFNETLNTFPNDIDDLSQEEQTIYKNWLNTLPNDVTQNMRSNYVTTDDIPFSLIPRDILLKYATQDAILTYEIYLMMTPVLKNRGQDEAYTLERKLILPLFRMTRTGFKINKPYVLETKARLKAYIKKRQKDLVELAGTNITANQNAVIKELLNNHFRLNVDSTGESVLEEVVYNLEQTDPDNKAINFIRTILELRTLSKWYSTYLMRLYNEMRDHDYIYPGLNASGTVTGRFTSDFQQFPKAPIKDSDGTELFEARKMFSADDGCYLLAIDYSQIELRIQALYTILIGAPDTNLCRAYMPYKTINANTHELFSYEKLEHIKRWNEKQPDGSSSWLLEDTYAPWKATDLHSATTKAIFPDIDPDSKEFKKLRSTVGKRANFACNYGAKPKRIHVMFPRESEAMAQRIYDAYVKTFPGVIAYQKWCMQLFNSQSYGTNLYGRRYFHTNGHNGANALIQGTAAYLLKEKVVDLDDYIVRNNSNIRMQMTVHDEILFRVPKNEVWRIPTLKAIMEDVPGSFVPIVAETEISETTWADKKGFDIDERANIKYHLYSD